MNRTPITHTLGYPRVGERRELKRATEAYWHGKLSRAELEEAGRLLRRQNWLTQQEAGIDLIPSNDFSFYDQMLDLTCLVGNVPPRFGPPTGQVDLDTRFAIARGVRPEGGAAGACGCQPALATHASEMTKWFDTNYHYIVPEFQADTRFALSSAKVFDEFSEALALGIRTKPVLIGPVTYLKLGKARDARHPRFDRLDLLERLLPVYIQALRRLAALGAEWVQLDEPIFTLDLTGGERVALAAAYATLAAAAPELKILVASYFGGLRENLGDFLRLPVHALHVDVVRAPEELDAVIRELIDPSTVPTVAAASSTVVVQNPMYGNGGAASGATPGSGDMAGDPNDPLAAHDSGIYVFTADHDGKPNMVELERTSYQGAKTGGMFTSALTYGISKAKSKAIIPGKAASIRVGDPIPVFYFYFDEKSAGLSSSSYFSGQNISNPNQFALVHLDADKNTRSAEIGEFSMWGASSGNNQKSVVAFKSERVKPGLYKVTLSGPLKPGEYCFMAAPVATSSYAGVAGATAAHDLFDFGVDK